MKSEFVMNGNVDDGWDEYLEALQGYGLDSYLEIMQKNLDNYYTKLEK